MHTAGHINGGGGERLPCDSLAQCITVGLNPHFDATVRPSPIIGQSNDGLGTFQASDLVPQIQRRWNPFSQLAIWNFFLHPLTSVGKIWSVYGTWLSGPQNQTYPYSLNTWSANTPEGVFFRDDNDDDDNNNSSSNNSRSIPGKRPRKAHGMKSLCSGFPPSIFPSIGLYL